MDYARLKNRPSFPFETIAVAVAFSPRLEAIISESAILARHCGAKLLFIHIGDRTRTKESRLEEIINRLHLRDDQYRIIWNEGDPVDALLYLCKLNVVDLLILGALKKENIFRYYLGSVARKISRKAKCSVLLLVDPQKEGSRFKKFVVNGVENPKTIHTVNTAIWLAQKTGTSDITVATEVVHTGLAMTIAEDSTATEASRLKKTFNEEELERTQEIIEKCVNHGEVQVCEKLIKGKPGYAIRKYAEQKKADLLVVNSPDTKMGIIDRIFTHDIEYILEDLPCNVLIVHSRVQKDGHA